MGSAQPLGSARNRERRGGGESTCERTVLRILTKKLCVRYVFSIEGILPPDEESGESTVAREPDESSSSGKGSGAKESEEDANAADGRGTKRSAHDGDDIYEEMGTGKRKGAASGAEREGEAGERAGKKKRRRGGSQKGNYQSGYHERARKRGEIGSQEEAPR